MIASISVRIALGAVLVLLGTDTVAYPQTKQSVSNRGSNERE